MAKNNLPPFENLQDATFDGMYFKDEGDFLIVKFEKDTKKPAGDGMYAWGSLTSTYLTPEDYEKLNTKKELKDFLTGQL